MAKILLFYKSDEVIKNCIFAAEQKKNDNNIISFCKIKEETFMKTKVIEVLNTIYDPEIPVNIWELGFIYKLEVNENNDVYILMTLTAPNCPVAESLPMEVQTRVSMIPGVNKVVVDVTFDPPWTMDRMTDAAKMELGLLY